METLLEHLIATVAARDVAVMGESGEGQFTPFTCSAGNTEDKMQCFQTVLHGTSFHCMRIRFLSICLSILNSVCLQLGTGICILKKKKSSQVAMTHYDPQPGWQSLEIIKIKGTKET